MRRIVSIVVLRLSDVLVASALSQPTVLTNTKPEMKVVREEIFGPVVCAESFSDADIAGPGIVAATGLDALENAGCVALGSQVAGQMTPLPPGVEVSF